LEKESNKNNNVNLNNLVYFVGQDQSIFLALQSLTSETKKFHIIKKKFEKKMDLSKNFLILDDSCKNFHANLNYLKKYNFKNFLVTLNRENIYKDMSLNNFYKPLQVFDLYKAVINKLSSNKITDDWYLDKSSLQLFKNKKTFIRLTEKEFAFIYFLINQKDESATKYNLLKKIWKINLIDSNQIIETRVVETIVSRIRKKFSIYKSGPKLIKIKEGYKIIV